MAAFTETGTFLKFGEKPNVKSKPILWPVMVYRVLYPEIQTPRINLFQRAILGLIRAKTTRAETIADLTGLHQDLVKLIFAQSRSNGWLDEKADNLTEHGLQVLKDEEDSAVNLRSGYIFQDAITGTWWPRFETQLNDISAIDPSAEYPEFIVARKTGRPMKPFLLHGSKSSLPQPDASALMSAYKEYRNDYRASKQLYGSAELPEKIKLQGVQNLDVNPLAAHVLVWVTADMDGAKLWSIKDPFELREQAWWLDKALMESAKNNHYFLKELSWLIGKPQAENQTVEEWLAALQQQTDLRVLTEYPWVERQPDIKRYLARLLEWQVKLEQGQTSDYELEAAVVECQKLLEVVMQWLIKTFPADVGKLPRNVRLDASDKRKLLKALQVPALNDELVMQLSRQNFAEVVRACSSPTSSLKALLFAAAFGVLTHPQHPLKTLTDQQLQLNELMALATLRNPSGHGQSKYTGKKITQVTPQMAEQRIQYALDFTEHFKEWM